jgi:D-aminoacyl-tRNA deacylase
MRVVLQRVREASVTVEGSVVGAIEAGMLLLVGFTEGDDEGVLDWMAHKVVDLRIFLDDEGKMNRSLSETGGGILVVSQFTLYGDVRKGRRPSFVGAATPPVAIPLYQGFLQRLREIAPGPVQAGEFGAMMTVSLVNDGPVTLLLERRGEGWS